MRSKTNFNIQRNETEIDDFNQTPTISGKMHQKSTSVGPKNLGKGGIRKPPTHSSVTKLTLATNA